MNRVRTFIGALVAFLGLGLIAVLFAPGDRAVATPTRFTSSLQCRECHADVFEEWAQSQHADAWTGEAVRALSNEFSNQDCIDCHAPRPVFEVGLGNRVLPRTLNRVEGVDCLACHALPDGGMAGSLDNERAACRPRTTRALVSVEHCAGCHNQHQTVDQWRSSRYAEQGVGCVDCHMPHRDGDPNAPRTHFMHGGSSIDNLRRAVALEVELEQGAWVAYVESTGTGHSFPTDERSRAADVFYRRLDGAGEPSGPWRHAHRFRSPYRHEADLETTLLEVHERRRIPLLDGPLPFIGSGSQPEGAPVVGPIEVGLFYMRKPYFSDLAAPDPEADATRIHSVVVGL